MKNVFLMLAVAAIFSLTACAQTGKNVPAKVKTSFNNKFPEVKKVSWDKENAHEWEAEFKMNGQEYSANFATDGTWKETEYRVKVAALPKAVKSTLESEFKGYNVEMAEVSETHEGKVFEIKIENDEHEMEVVIDGNGKVIKNESKNEQDEEGDNENDEKGDND
jgi:hypothetical protein